MSAITIVNPASNPPPNQNDPVIVGPSFTADGTYSVAMFMAKSKTQAAAPEPPTKVTIQLYDSTGNTPQTPEENCTIPAPEQWTYTFNNLPANTTSLMLVRLKELQPDGTYDQVASAQRLIHVQP